MTALTFLHLTDPHLHPDHPLRADRLRAVLTDAAAINADFVAITGDLTDAGDLPSYGVLRDALAGCAVPVMTCLGNHDLAANFAAVMPERAQPWRVAVVKGVQLVFLDSQVAGRSGGALDAALLDAVAARLTGPALLFLHHPPDMDGSGPQWDRLDPGSTDALARLMPRFTALFCGHIHLDRVTIWQGVPVFGHAGLSSAIDPRVTDCLRVTEGAGYAIVRWQRGAQGGALSVTQVALHPARAPITDVPLARLRS